MALKEDSITMTKLSIQPWLLRLTITTFLFELGYKVLEKKVILIVSRSYSKNTYIQTFKIIISS